MKSTILKKLAVLTLAGSMIFTSAPAVWAIEETGISTYETTVGTDDETIPADEEESLLTDAENLSEQEPADDESVDTAEELADFEDLREDESLVPDIPEDTAIISGDESVSDLKEEDLPSDSSDDESETDSMAAIIPADESTADIAKDSVDEKTVGAASGTWEGYTWKIDGTTLTVTGSGEMPYASNAPWHDYEGSVTVIKIGNYITRIGSYAFENFKYATAVYLGTRVRILDYQAFAGCSNLLKVTIPASVTEIGGSTFYQCDNLVKVTFSSGSKLEKIGSDAFGYCNNLTSITFPASLKTIESFAFTNNSNLVSVSFNNGLTRLGDFSFLDCKNLLKVTTPSTLKSIGDSAFDGCISMNSLTLNDGLTSIESYAFQDCDALTSVTIPSTVTTIESCAFDGCESLKSAIIKAPLVGNSMFVNCNSLTSVTLGSKVKSIGSCAFQYCSALPKITIPANVTSIGGDAFFQDSNLTQVNLTEGLTTIESRAFGNCNLKSITLPSTVVSIGSSAFEKNENLTSADISASKVTDISSYSFAYNTKLSSFKMNNKVTKISYNAFNGCTVLSSINFSTALTEIDNDAFFNCKSLTTLTLPAKVTTIGAYAFYNTGLKTVTLGTKVTELGYAAFSGCSSLTRITNYNRNTAYPSTLVSSDYPISLYGWIGSTSQTYADSKNNITFVAINSLAKPVITTCAKARSGVSVKWNAVPGAVYYTVKRSTSASSGYTDLDITTETSFLDTKAVSGRTYYYKIQAVNGSVKSALSDYKKVVFVAAPAKITYANTLSGMNVEWSKVANADGYYIYRKVNGGSYAKVATVTGNSKFTWLDKTAVSGKLYIYAVEAYDNSVVSLKREGSAFMRLTTPTISSVTNSAAGQMTVKWNKIAEARGYRIYYTTDSAFKTGVKEVTVSGTASVSKAIGGLTKGKTYYVRVRCYQKSGSTFFFSGNSYKKSVTITK